MKNSYHNTTNESTQLCLEYSAKAKSQEAEILRWMRAMGCAVGATNVSERFGHWPITSIRRALHNLKRDGQIQQMERRQIGSYGRSESTYKILVG
ncbi:MAG: hypothetical protein ACRBG0_19265 [Lewinella sp.]|uniref:hypothetical protein n=1 Tax=Lewinella sp. TaxID=2004506 RepID=UPI003D6B5875